VTFLACNLLIYGYILPLQCIVLMENPQITDAGELCAWCGRKSGHTCALSHSKAFPLGISIHSHIPGYPYTFAFSYFLYLMELLIMFFFNFELQVDSYDCPEEQQTLSTHQSLGIITCHASSRFSSPFTLMSQRNGYRYLVFKGLVNMTEKLTATQLNPTECNRTVSCGCPNLGSVWLPVAEFSELSLGEGNPHYLPIVYFCLAWSQNDGFAEASVFCITQQFSHLVIAEKVLTFCILYNFFMADFLVLTLLLNKSRNTSFFEAYRSNKKEIKKSGMKNL
jgi:hypothetical protein